MLPCTVTRGRTGRALPRRRLDCPKKPIVNPHSPSRFEILIVLELVLGFISGFQATRHAVEEAR